MLFLEARQVLFVGTLVLLALKVGAQTSNPDSSNPGCYSRCIFLIMDYDPTRTNDLCNKKTSLGDLFLSNIEDCADCVRKNEGLSSDFDQSDAQDVLDMVNLCQSLFVGDHEEMVSAMSVIKEQGEVVGTLVSTPGASRAFGTPNIGPLATNVDVTTAPTASSQAEPTNSTDEDSKSPSEENKSWIAGAVVGPIVGVALIIGIYFVILRRRKRRKTDAEPAIDEKKEHGGWTTYEKTELPTKEHELHELNAENAKEAPAIPAPQELNSTVVAELPGNERS